jgi:DNA-binding NarL/FixJ family response regulator
MKPITVLLIDDHPLFRGGVRKTLDSDPDFSVVGEAGTGMDGLRYLKEKKPDVAIVDVNLPDTNGIQLTRNIVEERLGTRVILLTGYTDAEQPIHAFQAGCRAFCTKDIEFEHLAEVIRNVMQAKRVYESQVFSESDMSAWLDARIQELKINGDTETRFAPLTPRESEILQFVARGLTNKKIGYLLGISEQTVKNHLTSLLRKIGVNDRTQAVVYAIQHGWIHLPAEGMDSIDISLPTGKKGEKENHE